MWHVQQSRHLVTLLTKEGISASVFLIASLHHCLGRVGGWGWGVLVLACVGCWPGGSINTLISSRYNLMNNVLKVTFEILVMKTFDWDAIVSLWMSSIVALISERYL